MANCYFFLLLIFFRSYSPDEIAFGEKFINEFVIKWINHMHWICMASFFSSHSMSGDCWANINATMLILEKKRNKNILNIGKECHANMEKKVQSMCGEKFLFISFFILAKSGNHRCSKMSILL